MSLRKLLNNVPIMVRLQSFIGRRSFATKSAKDILETAQEEPVFLEEVSEVMEKKRNKSRLNPEHRNMVQDRRPYDEPLAWYHHRVLYKKRILGRYGMEALGDVPAGIAWPSPAEVEDSKEYERVAFPLTIQERWRKIKEGHKKKEEAIMARQQQIADKMANMKQVIAEVEGRVAKKQAEMQAAKEKKEQRLRDIRRKLGATGHVTNEKIKEMMEKMEKEDKKKKKELKKARALERQKRLLMKNMPTDGAEANAEEPAKGDPKARAGSPTEESTEEPSKKSKK